MKSLKKRFLILTFAILFCITLAGIYFYFFKLGDKPLTQYRPPGCKEILSANNQVLDYYCPFNGIRLWKSLKELPASLRQTVVLLEDAKFFAHEGFDFGEIRNSILVDIESGKFKRGASTITQQVAKNLFLNKDKTILRKASEVPLAIRIEKELSKSQILELYLNTIEWGPGIYGAEAAARTYFDKSASALDENECWLLALMIPNPVELNLWHKPRAAASVMRRAQNLITRLILDRQFSRSQAMARKNAFVAFINRWSSEKPQAVLTESRTYPFIWEPNSNERLSSHPLFKRALSGDRKHVDRITTYLDRDLLLRFNQPSSEKISAKTIFTVEADEKIILLLTQPFSKEDLSHFVAEQGYTIEEYKNLPSPRLWR